MTDMRDVEICRLQEEVRCVRAKVELLTAYAQHERSLGAEGPMIELVSARQEIERQQADIDKLMSERDGWLQEVERLRLLLRRHHLRGAYWDNELAVETRAALDPKS